jgi:hypothetical protein
LRNIFQRLLFARRRRFFAKYLRRGEKITVRKAWAANRKGIDIESLMGELNIS